MNQTLTLVGVSTPPNLRAVNSYAQTQGKRENRQAPTFCSETANKDKLGKDSQKKDPLSSYPLRLCAYTNEVGAAVSPIPIIGQKIFMLSWIPALLYFGADIYNKYAKGHDENYSTPSSKKAFNQAVFQGLASVLLPTAAVIAGQNVASKLSASFSKDKMDVRAKEDILNEIKRDLTQDKLRIYKKDINELIKDNPTLSNDEIKQLPKVKEIKQRLAENVFNEIKVESDTLKRHRKNSNIISKVFNIFVHSAKDCEHVSKISDDKFSEIVQPYVEKQLNILVDSRIDLQRAINPNGTMNEYSKHLEPSLFKKAQALLKKNMSNRQIVDKGNFVVKESLISQISKTAMKLSLIKIAGGFAFLALLAQPIDKFVEHVIISKFLEPKKK